MTGLQSSFSWRSVAASGLGAAAGARVGDMLDDALGMVTDITPRMDTLWRKAAQGMVAGATTAMFKGGRVAIQQVATDAFGNALGNSLGEAFKPVAPAEGNPPTG